MPRLRSINAMADRTLRNLEARMREETLAHRRLQEMEVSPRQVSVGPRGFSIGVGGGHISENEAHIQALCVQYGV